MPTRHRSNSRQGSRLKGIAVVLVLLTGGAFLFIVPAKLTQYLDKNHLYVEAISNDDKFKAPVTILVNRMEIPGAANEVVNESDRQARSAALAADVLEAAGLLTMSADKRGRTTPQRPEDIPLKDPTMIRTLRTTNEARLRNPRVETLLIQLTDKGHTEAASWTEVDEPARTGYYVGTAIPWWRIPIGKRELLGIDSANVVSERQESMKMVYFKWRWLPNKLGEFFDYSNPGFAGQSPQVQAAVRTLRWNSQTEYQGVAKMRLSGETWKVVELNLITGE